jgi:hypothetical protein
VSPGTATEDRRGPAAEVVTIWSLPEPKRDWAAGERRICVRELFPRLGRRAPGPRLEGIVSLGPGSVALQRPTATRTAPAAVRPKRSGPRVPPMSPPETVTDSQHGPRLATDQKVWGFESLRARPYILVRVGVERAVISRGRRDDSNRNGQSGRLAEHGPDLLLARTALSSRPLPPTAAGDSGAPLPVLRGLADKTWSMRTNPAGAVAGNATMVRGARPGTSEAGGA